MLLSATSFRLVMKGDSSTTKFRVVFKGSAKIGSNKSLNDSLLIAGHTDFQRILLRESIDPPLKHFRLLTVTYGTACATFLAVRTLLQLHLTQETLIPEQQKSC